ncbi:MAG: hypothetical protein ABI197_06835 [Granulicella sp.]
MAILLLLPLVFCVIALYRSTPERALVTVCLPVLLIIPVYLQLKLPLLPPIDAGEAVFLPLGIAMLFGRMRLWKFSRTDLWMVVLIISACSADYMKGDTTIGIFNLFVQVTTALFPYMAGKLLIEQRGQRVVVAKRIVGCVFLICVPAMFEFVAKKNLFLNALGRLDPSVWGIWRTQVRWGFGRVAGPYGQSELAGMILLVAILMTFWLGYWNHWSPRFARFPALPWKQSRVILLVLLATSITTQARGPWLGLGLGFAIAVVGLAKRVVLTSIVVAVVLAIGGTFFYTAGSNYLNAPTVTLEQQTAQYRQDLLKNYQGVAERGGAWGWGREFPRIDGQMSIDNQYLLTWLTRGYIGVAMLLLLMADTLFTLGRNCFGTSRREDRHFAFCLLGIFAGLMLTLGTVYLGEQSYEVFFLLVGWSQALGKAPVAVAKRRAAPQRDQLQAYT